MITKLRVVIPFILIFIITLLGFYTYKSTREYKNATSWVSHTYEVIGVANGLLYTIQDIESGQRGYAITGDDKFLDTYVPSLKQIDESFRRLKYLVKDNPKQLALLDSIQPIIKLKEEFAQATINVRKATNGLRLSQDLIATGEGEEMMKRIYNNLSLFIKSENDLLSQRLDKANADFYLAIIYIMLGLCVTIVTIITGAYVSQKDFRRRKQVELSLTESEALIKKFLNSLPVGIFILDKNGNAYYANDKSTEILGKGILPETTAGDLPERYDTVKIGTNIKYPSEQLPIVRALRGETNLLIEDLEILRRGEHVPLRVNATSIKNERGEVEYAISVFEDVTSLKEAEARLKEANRLAQESVVLKETFLANMSHEIRTPMNAILGFTDLLLKQEMVDKQKDYVKTIKTSGENLLRIINDILDVSKIESGVMTFEQTPISITELFVSLKNMLYAKAADKNIDLLFECENNVPGTVLGDSTRLTQIIVNLVGNAVKFTDKGMVSVLAKMVKEHEDYYDIEFSVKDTGIGIPENKLKDIFERFRQAESSTTRNYGGTGLGLSIAKELVEMQGGNIEVKSMVGVGSVFTFRLPLKKADKILKEPKAKKQDVNLEELKKIKILMVEDNPINIKFIESLFSEYGLKTDVARNGRLGLEAFKKEKYDIVLMDIEMPEMNGYETADAIRRDLKSNTPIIAMTANAMAGEREKCLQAGMNDYISKPIQPEVLFDKLYGVKLSMNNQPKSTEQGNEVNLEFLISSMQGNKQIIKETIDVILQEIPDDMLRIGGAVDKKNYLDIKRSVHRMKSTVGLIGAEKTRNLLSAMEILGAEERDMDKILSYHDELKALYTRILSELENEKNKFA